jgi:hypothetical protein
VARGVTLARAEIKGVEAVISKLKDNPVHARPWKRGLYAALRLGKATAESRAPKGESGKLAARNRYRIAPGRVPLWGVVTNSASRKGFKYGFALNAGRAKRKNGRAYEFNRRSGGGSTRSWFTGVLAVIQGRVNSILGAAAREIESEWQR